MRRLLSLSAAVCTVLIVPRTLAGGAANEDAALAEEVAASVKSGADRPTGEWGLVTDQMIILGLGQRVLAHPEEKERWLPVMEQAAEHMLQPAQRTFATREWGSDGLAHLDDERGEAWLGWPDMALSMLRRVNPDTRFAAVNDRITAALTRRLSRAPHGLIETYPGMSFPTDVAACAAAISLHAEATGQDARPLLEPWAQTFRAEWVDAKSGYLWQRGNARTGAHQDAPRGRGPRSPPTSSPSSTRRSRGS